MGPHCWDSFFFTALSTLRTGHSAGSQEAPEEDPTERIRFVATIAAYSLYAGLICYLLVHSLEGGYTNEAIYTVAMALHFTSLRYSLWNEYGDIFGRLGKNILGVSCLAGWLIAVFLPQPLTVIITLLGFVSGGVIMTTMMEELPEERGRALPVLLPGRSSLRGTSNIDLINGGERNMSSLSVAEGIIVRLAGPMSLRFVIQPLIALLLGLRDGMMDAKAGEPTFILGLLHESAWTARPNWSVFSNPCPRRLSLHSSSK